MTAIAITSSIIGWLYFACWSLSFYPQVILNYQRKSVVGLSFDFLYFNVTGYICYSIFNSVLFWDPIVKQQYLIKYGPPIPVQPNDIAFAIHGFIITVVTIAQCFIYERGDQKNSMVGIIIGIGIWASLFIIVGLGAGGTITWLFVIYWLSYVKLFITFIKYVPQAYINFKRKSTVGWSIGNVLLDFSGGILSLLQLLLDAVESHNYKVFIGDPVKFGLSLFSIAFDILFMIQHYILYRERNNYQNLTESSTHPHLEDNNSISSEKQPINHSDIDGDNSNSI
ncbi:cystinosin [Tieghemostelium lacteum]|uniref:Cystinosin homolog n=1 Tax=Tieghemostelium lacteum TaxID=361077 RepID=A0A151ZBH9_TIELA|nr:cystinosin [Tieghemostelium lacteum]|eukprot:KYQ91300.1 cystinosin [Tieghemostelium lacteum]